MGSLGRRAAIAAKQTIANPVPTVRFGSRAANGPAEVNVRNQDLADLTRGWSTVYSWPTAVLRLRAANRVSKSFSVGFHGPETDLPLDRDDVEIVQTGTGVDGARYGQSASRDDIKTEVSPKLSMNPLRHHT